MTTNVGFPMATAPVAAGGGYSAEVSAAREQAEVQSQVIMAMRNPRVRERCVADIIEECKRYELAVDALYSFPRGRETVSDGSIKLALVMAQNWGNIDIGVREVERLEGESIVESYCWDLQKNFRQRRRFSVPHVMKAGNQLKRLVDPRDIYEHAANMGARRLRSCIFDVIPSDVKRAAIEQVKRTLAQGQTDSKGRPLKTLSERVATMLASFKSLGVDDKMIERRLGHKIELTTVDELVELSSIHNSIREGAKRSEFFEFDGADSERSPDGKSGELAREMKRRAAEASEVKTSKARRSTSDSNDEPSTTLNRNNEMDDDAAMRVLLDLGD